MIYRCECGPSVTMGGYENQETVPVPEHMRDYLEAREGAGLAPSVCIDRCILTELRTLWDLGVRTYGSCCGHNMAPAFVNVHEFDDDFMVGFGYVRYAVEGCWPHTFYLRSGCGQGADPGV